MKLKRLNKSELKRVSGYFKRNGLKASYYKVVERLARDKSEQNMSADVFDIIEDKELRELQAAKQFKHRYKFSIVVPAYETDEKYLTEMLNSVFIQTYDNWELCIADASESDVVKNTVEGFIEKICKPASETDDISKQTEAVKDKVKYKKIHENKGISANTNEALSMAAGEYVAFLDHDDLLSENALFEVMCTLDKGFEYEDGIVNNKYKLIYSDEDKFSEDREAHFDFHIKPDFDLELLRTNNYICHLLVVRREIVRTAGGFNSEYDGAQDHDFILRAAEQLERDEIAHIPKILYHWRSHTLSTAANPESKMYAYEAGKRAVSAHLKRLSIDAEVTDTEHLGFYRVKYNVSAEDLTKVEIMTLDELKSMSMEELRAADYEYIMVLNDGIKPKSYDFIEEMLGYLLRDEVGCVGGLVIGKGGRIESAGYKMDMDGTLKPEFSGLNRHFSGYLHRAKLAREVDGVCTDCMMLKKSALTYEHVLKPDYLVIYSPYSIFKRR